MSSKVPVSIFNDVIGPVMRGPSSSRCAAALRIGRLARDLMSGESTEVLVEFDRNGSLPTTDDSQGSDMGLFGGLMGWEADDERLPNSMQILRESGVGIRIETVDAGDPHPNTYRLTLRHGQERHFVRASSTGGGMMEVLNVDGFTVSLFGDCFESLLWVGREGHKRAQELAMLVSDDAILVHEAAGEQSVAAASMTFQSMLGLVCDPIANRVEAPCLGKNVMAASNALACANMALAGYDPVIPLDEVIETAQRVAGQMPREQRCTALGGLSITPTSQAIGQRLAAKKTASCGSGCACH